MERCDATAGCVDVSFVAPSCYLKSSVTTALSRDYVWTGLKVPKPISSSATTSTTAIVEQTATGTDAPASTTGTATGTDSATSEGTATGTDSATSEATATGTDSATSATTATGTSSSAVPASTQPSCVNGQSNMANYTTSAGTVYEIICGQEYYGGDLSLVGAPTLKDCIETCDWTDSCVDVSWVNGMCYMKQQLNGLVTATGVSTARKVIDPSLDAKPPLTCEQNAANGTIYKTDAGKFYEIYCGFDFPGGDIQGLTTPSFEKCLDACDGNLECVDVAYVAPACYLKRDLNPPTPGNAAVWGAKSVADPGCAALSTTLYPVSDTGVDRSSLDNLVPSLETTLNYAEKQPGTKAASLLVSMVYPQVTLENSDLVSVTCAEGSVTVQASSLEVQQYIMSNWPSSGLVLFTNFEGCNNETSRGIFRTTASYATMGSNAITFSVTVETYSTIASEVAIKYGTVKYPSPSAAPSTTQYYSTCSETGTATVPATGTASTTGAAQTTLSEGAKALYDALMDAVQYNDDGNMVMHPQNLQDVELTPNPYDPDNTDDQAALEDKFREWGLDDPSSLGAQGASGAKGVCGPPTKTTTTTSVPARRSIPKARRSSIGSFFTNAVSSLSPKLAKRLSWDDVTGVACDDLVGDIVGEASEGAGAALGLACAGNDLYQNRDGLSCFLTGCYTTTTIITYYTPPPATQYNFDYSWKLTYPALKQAVRYQGAKTLSCDNCGFAISNIQFSGQIVINMTAGVIKEATITAGISGDASMVAGLNTDGAWSGSWDYTYSNSDLGAITLDNAFNIVPTVLYGIGINYNTDSAVVTSGGAQFNLNKAAVTMDLLTGNILSQQNWAPTITFTNPAFTTGSNIQLTPFMRWAVNLAVGIYGQVALSPTITSETVVGLGSSYSFAAQGSCPANNLQVTSYVSTKNLVTNGRGTTKTLFSDQQYNAAKCYNVPSNQPSDDDIKTLSASAQDYCTSYINYKAPTVYTWITSTATVPSVSTTSTTTTVTSTPTITVYPTTTTTAWFTHTSTTSTVHVTATNNAVFPTGQNMRRAEAESLITLAPVSQKASPLPTTTAQSSSPALRVDRRAVAPALVSGWPASKISYACSQIATGKATVTSTASATVTSGVTVTTRTITANAQGPLQTVTQVQTITVYGGFTTVTAPGPTTVTDYSCPLQTQVSSTSCIKVKAHGLPHIDGLYLGYTGGYGNPNFSPDNQHFVWYLSCEGKLEAFGSPVFSTMGGLPGQQYFLTIGWGTPAVCAKNTDTKALDCSLPGDSSPLMILGPGYALPSYDMDTRVYSPLWGVDYPGSAVIGLTYEETECLCTW